MTNLGTNSGFIPSDYILHMCQQVKWPLKGTVYYQ